jgi:hypothetical protein
VSTPFILCHPSRTTGQALPHYRGQGVNFGRRSRTSRGQHSTPIHKWRDFATLADGTAYVNDGAHAIQIRWGKVVVLHAYLDTQIVVDAMRAMAAAGVAEAAAPKIED